MTTVRPAETTDWPEIKALGFEFYREAPTLGYFDPEIFATNWMRWIESGAGVAFVLEIAHEVVGFIGALIAPEACNEALQAQELAWFVDPKARGVGRLLLNQLEIECAARGCSTLAMIALNALNADRLDRVYRRWGYEPVETLYRKRLG